MTLLQELESRLSTALMATLDAPVSSAVTVAADLRFGDYQSNASMVLAKQQKTNPRVLAQQIIDHLDLVDLGTADIAGPGFINFRRRFLRAECRQADACRAHSFDHHW